MGLSRRLGVFLCALLGAILFAATAGDSSGDAAEALEGNPPNVLIVLTDDQPVHSMQAMPKTQRWFRRKGVRFTDAYATTPFCCPSRASIASGLYAHNHGIRAGWSRYREALGDHSHLLESQLKSAGYRTSFFGKFLNGWDLSLDPPHFDSWAIFPNSSPNGYGGAIWNVDGERRYMPHYSTTYLKDRAVDFIRAEREQPWLMYVSTAAPHRPFHPEPKYSSARVRGWKRWSRRNPSLTGSAIQYKHRFVQENQRPPKAGQKVRRDQLRTLMSVDDLMKEVLVALRETGQRGNTLIVFLSDNGFMWGEHGVVGKLLPYTRSIKIPMMMSWPQGGVEAASVDTRMVANIDVAATVYDAVGIDGPQTDGRSLLDTTWERDRLLFEYWETHHRPTWASTRTKAYQYIEWFEDEPGTVVSFREYYDLVSDPYQLHNLLGEPDTEILTAVPALSARLNIDRNCSGRDCP